MRRRRSRGRRRCGRRRRRARRSSVRNYIGGEARDASGGTTLPLFDQATGMARGAVAASRRPTSTPPSARRRRRCATAAGRMRLRRSVRRCSGAPRPPHRRGGRVRRRRVGRHGAAASRADRRRPRAVANFEFFAGMAEHGAAAVARHGGGADRGGGLDAALNYVVRKPVGVVGLVTPWNLPLYLLSWNWRPRSRWVTRSSPSRRSSLRRRRRCSPTCSSALGCRPGCSTSYTARAATPAARSASTRGWRALVYGRDRDGRRRRRRRRPRFAKISLELGGKNSLIVFADCDIDTAVDGAVRASFLNSGQICLCASRILVENTPDGFYEKFATAFAARAAELAVGHPRSAATDLGPLVSAAQKSKVDAHVAAALALPGAVARCGGRTTRAPPPPPWHSAATATGWRPPCSTARAVRVSSRGVWAGGDAPPVRERRTAVEIANGTVRAGGFGVDQRRRPRARRRSGARGGTVWVNCWLHRELHMPFRG